MLKELDRYLKGVADGNVTFGNPVSDFLYTIDKGNVSKNYIENVSIDKEMGEAGFIDYMADIDDKIKLVTDTLNKMNIDLNVMTDGVHKSTDKIKQVSGMRNPSFVRQEVQIVANYISVFSSQVKIHNDVYLTTWPEIENNCLSLLESKYVKTEENLEGLKIFLKGLYQMKIASAEAFIQVKNMMDTFIATKGLQKSLNQAINTLEIDIKQFLEFISQMDSSINRILDKSKFVVGEIDFSTVDGEVID